MAKKKELESIKKLERIFNDSLDEFANQILINIEDMYESNITRFYNDYDPLYYRRTYSTYEGSSGYEDLFDSENIFRAGDIITAGIHVDSDYIFGNPYRAKNKDWVFRRTFERGIHGINTGNSFGKKRVRKYQRIKGKKVFEAVWHNSSGRTTKKKIAYGGRVKVMNRIMENTVPSPKAAMRKEFKRLTGKRNMKKMFNEVLSKNIDARM